MNLFYNRPDRHHDRTLACRISRILGVEQLESRCLMAVGDLRAVSYNIHSFNGSPSSDLGIVLQAIGNEVYAGRSRPIDLLAIQESRTQATATAAVVSQLNAIYGSGVYARGSVNGISGGGLQTVGLVYNTQTVQLVQELAIGNPTSTGTYRQTIRYQLRHVGLVGAADFYLYNSHFKAGIEPANGAVPSDEQRRALDAQVVKANADSLPQGTQIIFAGDFNTKSGFEPAFQTLISPGNGQAVDPLNRIGAWNNNASFLNILTQAPTNTPPGTFAGGGLDDRFDFLLVSNELLDGVAMEYAPGSYRTFGNNGSVPLNGSINDPRSTALPNLANRQTILNLLTTVTDHLPVVSDYYFVSMGPTAITLNQTSTLENRLFDAVIGTFTSLDPNSASYTYSLVNGDGGADNQLFRIDGNRLKTGAVFNYEVRSVYSIRVQVSDTNGVTFQRSIAIQILNDNEAPAVSVGGPYEVLVDEIFSLDSFAMDPDSNQAFNFEWDLNYDGRFDIDVIGSHPTVSFTQPETRVIAVRVRDNGAPKLQSIALSTITIRQSQVSAARNAVFGSLSEFELDSDLMSFAN